METIYKKNDKKTPEAESHIITPPQGKTLYLKTLVSKTTLLRERFTITLYGASVYRPTGKTQKYFLWGAQTSLRACFLRRNIRGWSCCANLKIITVKYCILFVKSFNFPVYALTLRAFVTTHWSYPLNDSQHTSLMYCSFLPRPCVRCWTSEAVLRWRYRRRRWSGRNVNWRHWTSCVDQWDQLQTTSSRAW